LKPGFWLVKCCRNCPEVIARIYWCDHEPGVPENKCDQPYLQGQLGLDLVDPSDIWAMLEFCEASPEQQQFMREPPLSDSPLRPGQEKRLPGLVTAPMSRWKQARARRTTAANFDFEVKWLRWAERNAPNHHKLAYRKPIDPMMVPIPVFVRS
jgi:hypothetical protein